MVVIIRPDAEAAAGLVARIIGAELRARPRLVLGLAAGCTMESVYEHLGRMHHADGLDFSACRTFNLDEYVGLSAEDPQSYRAYMNHHLFGEVNVVLRNTFVPDGMARDLDAECANYESLIREAGKIDLQLLGIGRTGHLGFNEPLSALTSRTRVVVLSPVTRRQNAPLFPHPGRVPHCAITVGVGTILESRRCVLLATGRDKAEIVARAIEGPLTSMVSASALQLHPDCTVVLDEAAAGHLVEADYYRSIFETDPKWRLFREAPVPRPAATTGGTKF